MSPSTPSGKPDSASAPAKNAQGKTKKAPKPTRPDEMSAEVIEFITAIDDYKRTRGRPFPNWSEVLEIVKQLGYAKQA